MKKIAIENIDIQIRRHSLIVQRLNNIKEMKLIIQGESKQYKKYMNDKIFVEGVRHRLEIEKELLEDLLNNYVYEVD
jgi:hypothetical protein